MKKGLLERLAAGPVICAEGYLFEMERRGYVQAGAFVPEVVLDHPEKVAELHREFVHAGSDTVEAFTYYAHREKLRIIDKEHLLEKMNKGAIEIAKKVAAETGALVAGDICNTNIFDPASADSKKAVRAMFEEQVAWAAEAGVDYIIAETFSYVEEAEMAAQVIKAAKIPAVVTMAMHQESTTRDGLSPEDACKSLEDAGADVVGLNCCRGIPTLAPLLEAIVKRVGVPVAALPVPYRTSPDQPTFQSLRDPKFPGKMAFPTALDPFTCTRDEVAEFTKFAQSVGVKYFGLCCGGAPHHIRSMSEALGRKPPASRYTADMSKHAYFGTNQKLKTDNQEYSKKL
jgi:betaine-homocysteine S-methyltransferase